MLTATELQQLAAKHIPGTKKQHHKRMKLQDLKRSLCKLQDNQEDLDLDVDVQSLLRESVTLDEDARRVLSHVQFAYFLNEEQGLERFILRETGLLNYPQYKVRISRQIFSTRVELMQYQEALRLDFELQTAMEKNDSVRMRQIICQSCLKLGYVLEEEEWTKSSTQKMCHLTKAYFCKHSNNSDASASTSSITTPSWQQCFCASWVHVTIARQGISLLEKHKRYADAIELIQVLLGRPEQPSKRGDWWNRFAIDLEHMGKVETSLEIAETALADKWVRVGHRLSLQRRVLRLGRPPRRWKKPAFAERASWSPRERKVVGRPTNRMKSVKSNFVGFDDADISVEHLAIQYYSRDEFGSWNGLHCENGIWNTLFALVMWDILFSDLPDVFQHPFQTGPLDLDTDYFYSMRKDSIDARLKEISNGMGPQLVEKIYAKHSEAKTLCSGLSWDKYSLEQLLEITKCVGGPGLAVIVRLLAQDHKHWRSGMPDLILWRTEPSQASKLVEVKGPRDTLADHQRAWLAELSFGGLDVEICRVYEP
jgi:Fanconi-associated nuclease 1